MLQITELKISQNVTVRKKGRCGEVTSENFKNKKRTAYPKCMLVITIDRLGCKKETDVKVTICSFARKNRT